VKQLRSVKERYTARCLVVRMINIGTRVSSTRGIRIAVKGRNLGEITPKDLKEFSKSVKAINFVVAEETKTMHKINIPNETKNFFLCPNIH